MLKYRIVKQVKHCGVIHEGKNLNVLDGVLKTSRRLNRQFEIISVSKMPGLSTEYF